MNGEQEGWIILTHNDSTDLKPGQYLLTEKPPERALKFDRLISAKLRAEIFDRNLYLSDVRPFAWGY
jgi:hypothetical protein